MEAVKAPNPELEKRVAALRRLARQDVVPAVQEAIQLCLDGEDVVLSRQVDGVGKLLGHSGKPVRVRFPVPEPSEPKTSEAAIVFGALAAAQPTELWRGRSVVELGCGAGFCGVVLAALGARVLLTDRTEVEGNVMASIAFNASSIKPPGAASFCTLDWTEPRDSEALATLNKASLVVAVDPAESHEEAQNFIKMAKAVMGLDSGRALCPNAEGFLLVHKHTNSYCIAGYSAPSSTAAPTVSLADECSRCTFRRDLEDAGIKVAPFDIPVPSNFKHPFVECWQLAPSPNTRLI
jgi:hypothetical protein